MNAKVCSIFWNQEPWMILKKSLYIFYMLFLNIVYNFILWFLISKKLQTFACILHLKKWLLWDEFYYFRVVFYADYDELVSFANFYFIHAKVLEYFLSISRTTWAASGQRKVKVDWFFMFKMMTKKIWWNSDTF